MRRNTHLGNVIRLLRSSARPSRSRTEPRWQIRSMLRGGPRVGPGARPKAPTGPIGSVDDIERSLRAELAEARALAKAERS